MWDTVKESYSEVISSAFPAHRVLVVAFGFICSIAITKHNYVSVIETILRFELGDLSTASGKLFEHASLFDCLWGLLLCGVSVITYRFLGNTIFSFISTVTDYKNRVSSHYKQFTWLAELSSDERNQAINRVESEKKSQHKALRFYAIGSELAVAVWLAIGFTTYWGNALDMFVAVVALILAIALQARFVHLFLSKYLGPALQESILNGTQEAIWPPK